MLPRLLSSLMAEMYTVDMEVPSEFNSETGLFPGGGKDYFSP